MFFLITWIVVGLVLHFGFNMKPILAAMAGFVGTFALFLIIGMAGLIFPLFFLYCLIAGGIWIWNMGESKSWATLPTENEALESLKESFRWPFQAWKFVQTKM